MPVVTVVVGLLGILAALLVPFAPVLDRDTTVTWPAAGEQPESTTAFFVPYAPESVAVDVPCPVVRAAIDRDEPTTIVGSDRVGADTTGFTVTTADGQLRVLVGGREIHRAPVPAGDACGVRLTADADGSVLQVADTPPETFPQDRVRSVRAFTTELAPGDATGLQVQARTADWFTADPTVAKNILVTVQVLLAVGALALLGLADRRRRPPRARSAALRVWRSRAAESVSPRGLARKVADVVVVAVLGVWTVIGPLSPDDGFTESIVRNAAGTDAFTNFHRWENASEAPFTLVLQLVQPWIDAGATPLGLRLLSTLAGIATWLLLSRVALPVLLPRHARRAWVRSLLCVSLLVWWMPFNLGIRPEPFAALAVTATLAFALRAAARSRHSGVWLGAAALTFGLSLAVAPSAVAVAGPVLVLVPALLRMLRGRGTRAVGALHTTGAVLAAAALAAVGPVLAFTGQSWYTVLRSTRMHAFYGPNVGWFDEFRRYELLFAFDDPQGGMGRRLPVLITLALLVAVLPLIARGTHRVVGLRWVPVAASGTVLGLVLLGLTPSKWTHYFGTLAGLGAAALTTGVVLLVLTARRRADEAAVRAGAAAGTLALVLGAAVAFSGKNDWFLYSHWGVPHDDGPFWPLNTPLIWLLPVGLVLATGLVAGARRRDVRTELDRALVRVPAVLTVVVATTTIAVLLGSFAVAPGNQRGSYSVGEQMTAHLRGDPTCGILDHVVTVDDPPGGVLTPGPGAEETVGFTANGGYRAAPPVEPGTGASTYLWGSASGGGVSTGTLSSRWFTLAQLGDDQELAVDVAGRTAQGNQLALEFAPAGDGTAPSLGERVLDDTDTDPDARPDYPADRIQEQRPLDRPGWRTITLDPGEIPQDAGLVRVRAVDDTTGPGGWLAVTGPRVRDLRPALDGLRPQDDVYADWSLLWAVPCVRGGPRVADGLATAPDVLVRGPSDLGFAGDATFVAGIGGSFAPMRLTGTEQAVPTRLEGSEGRPRYADWGAIVRVTYPFARDAYDRSTTTVQRWGWEGDRTPIGYPEIPRR